MSCLEEKQVVLKEKEVLPQFTIRPESYTARPGTWDILCTTKTWAGSNVQGMRLHLAPMDPAPNVAVSLTSPWPAPRRRLRWVQHAAGPTATTHAMCVQSDCARVEVLDLHASAPHLILSGSGVTYRHRKQKSAQHKRCDPHRDYRSHPPLLIIPRWWLCLRSARIWETCG